MTAYPFTAELIDANFATAPYDHQIREFERGIEAKGRALAWTMRTGKSKFIVDRACHLFTHDKIDGVLVFAPNGVHANWLVREVPKHAWSGVEYETLIWRTSTAGPKRGARLPIAERAAWQETREAWWNRLKLIRTSRALFWLSINTESMTRADVRRVVKRFMKWRRVLVVFDESDDFGVPGSKRTKMARALARRAHYRNILSGTLAHASPLATFTQYELLEKCALGFQTYDAFEAFFADYELSKTRGGRRYPKLKGFKNLDILRERMAKFTSVVLREECEDMPALIYRTVAIEPSEQQLEAYRQLHESFMVDVEAGRVSVGERATRFGKLQQVFSGFVMDEFGKSQKIAGPNPRLEALSWEVFLAPGKVVIWCQFQPDMDFVRARLRADGVKFAEYHGRVSEKDKAAGLKSFVESKECKALIAHEQSASRGQDFSVADSIFFYSHTFKARLRAQAVERATKIGGRNIHVVDFVAPGPDQYIRSVVEQRINVADALAGIGMRDFLREIAL